MSSKDQQSQLLSADKSRESLREMSQDMRQSVEGGLNRSFLNTAEKLGFSVPGTAESKSREATPPPKVYIQLEEPSENPNIAKYFPTVINTYEIPQRPNRFKNGQSEFIWDVLDQKPPELVIACEFVEQIVQNAEEDIIEKFIKPYLKNYAVRNSLSQVYQNTSISQQPCDRVENNIKSDKETLSDEPEPARPPGDVPGFGRILQDIAQAKKTGYNKAEVMAMLRKNLERKMEHNQYIRTIDNEEYGKKFGGSPSLTVSDMSLDEYGLQKQGLNTKYKGAKPDNQSPNNSKKSTLTKGFAVQPKSKISTITAVTKNSLKNVNLITSPQFSGQNSDIEPEVEKFQPVAVALKGSGLSKYDVRPDDAEFELEAEEGRKFIRQKKIHEELFGKDNKKAKLANIEEESTLKGNHLKGYTFDHNGKPLLLRGYNPKGGFANETEFIVQDQVDRIHLDPSQIKAKNEVKVKKSQTLAINARDSGEFKFNKSGTLEGIQRTNTEFPATSKNRESHTNLMVKKSQTVRPKKEANDEDQVNGGFDIDDPSRSNYKKKIDGSGPKLVYFEETLDSSNANYNLSQKVKDDIQKSMTDYKQGNRKDRYYLIKEDEINQTSAGSLKVNPSYGVIHRTQKIGNKVVPKNETVGPSILSQNPSKLSIQQYYSINAAGLKSQHMNINEQGMSGAQGGLPNIGLGGTLSMSSSIQQLDNQHNIMSTDMLAQIDGSPPMTRENRNKQHKNFHKVKDIVVSRSELNDIQSCKEGVVSPGLFTVANQIKLGSKPTIGQPGFNLLNLQQNKSRMRVNQSVNLVDNSFASLQPATSLRLSLNLKRDDSIDDPTVWTRKNVEQRSRKRQAFCQSCDHAMLNDLKQSIQPPVGHPQHPRMLGYHQNDGSHLNSFATIDDSVMPSARSKLNIWTKNGQSVGYQKQLAQSGIAGLREGVNPSSNYVIANDEANMVTDSIPDLNIHQTLTKVGLRSKMQLNKSKIIIH